MRPLNLNDLTRTMIDMRYATQATEDEENRDALPLSMGISPCYSEDGEKYGVEIWIKDGDRRCSFPIDRQILKRLKGDYEWALRTRQAIGHLIASATREEGLLDPASITR